MRRDSRAVKILKTDLIKVKLTKKIVSDSGFVFGEKNEVIEAKTPRPKIVKLGKDGITYGWKLSKDEYLIL